jgi:small-conductance mechanosensitive channel
MLIIAAERTQSVLQEPAPFTVLLSLDNYSVNYEINAYLKPGVRRYVGLAELNRNVLDVFNEYNIAIMTPSYFADPADPKVVAKENWYAAPSDPHQTPAPPPRDFPPPRS